VGVMVAFFNGVMFDVAKLGWVLVGNGAIMSRRLVVSEKFVLNLWIFCCVWLYARGQIFTDYGKKEYSSGSPSFFRAKLECLPTAGCRV
ncbi:MAG: hypothetical protein K1V72_02165, partial [Duncaniella sp.]